MGEGDEKERKREAIKNERIDQSRRKTHSIL